MNYGQALYLDTDATLDDLREAVTTLEETKQIARRVLGGAHPLTRGIEGDMRNARAALRARDTPSTSGSLPEQLAEQLAEAKGLEFNDVVLYNFFKDERGQGHG